jgi:hypothetical protein
VRFLEANVDPNVLIEQYEFNNASYAPAGQPKALLRPAAYRQGAQHSPIDAALVISGTTGATASTGEQTEIPSAKTTGHAEQEAKQKQTEAEQAAAQSQEKAEREGKNTQAKASREAKETQEKAQQAGKRAALQAEEANTKLQNGSTTGTQHAKVEEARVEAIEAAKIKSEDQHHGSVVPTQLATPPLQHAGNAEVAVGTATPKSAVEAVLNKAHVAQAPVCEHGCEALKPTVDKAIADYSSNLDAAAREIVRAFGDLRMSKVEHEREPLGATIHYSIDFVGYAGKLMTLEWTLYSKQTGPLPREWWRNVIVREIRPTHDGMIHGSFWAPEPSVTGDYYFRLRVFQGQQEVADKETDPFH